MFWNFIYKFNTLRKVITVPSLCFCRLLVERIFAQYMVPHNLETTERMKCLYYLYATLDLNAVKYVSNVKFCSYPLLQCILWGKKIATVFLNVNNLCNKNTV